MNEIEQFLWEAPYRRGKYKTNFEAEWPQASPEYLIFDDFNFA
jgi:hypothetical protein